MSDIADWLSKLGLEKYAPAFDEAEIEFADLPNLTSDDLKEVGLPVGPRRRVQQAIEQLDDRPDAPVHAPVAAEPVVRGATVDGPPSTDAERRHLSVMFVDLVGSTEMATKVDPEEVRAVITRYQNTVSRIVKQHDGFIARYMGDGVLCYFGWPRANEDDAERAVRAGLEIISSIRSTSGVGGAALATRVGIATGVVIVGDLIGSGASEEAAVVGETPNLAARLQGLAKPNQLAVAEETHKLLGNVFEHELLGAQPLKGIAEPVNVYLVLGETARESRFDAHHAGPLTPIVGRERELQLVRECWARALAGTGQMVVVSGEAGIGKSRITRAVIDEIGRDSHVRITYQCSAYHSDSAFYPIIQQLTYASGIHPTDTSNARLDKLERLSGIDAGNMALIAALLGIDASERCTPLDLTPAQLRAQTIQMLVQLLATQAQQDPVLAVFEDLHWVDPTTLELLDVALDRVGDERILVLATARPTFEHGFGGHPIVTRLVLNRLGKEQTLSIVMKLTGGKALPEEVLQLIASRTDGVPLFVEELTKTVLETGAFIDEGDRLVLGTPLDALAIPSTLHDSLMARLDRLQPMKEVAQTAACIGREFEHGLLAGVLSLSAADLGATLDALIKAELIYRRGLPPAATYLFKHALVRDAAYESLLKDRRRRIHSRILAFLEKEQGVRPELLAKHAEAAALTDRAIELWEAASKAAIARPAYDEGISHLQHAIALVTPLIETGERAPLERALGLQIQLGVASLARRGYQAEATRSAFEDALALADRIGETPLRYPVLYGLWVGMYVRAEHAQAWRQAEALVRVAEHSMETAPLVVAHRLAGVSLSFQGKHSQAQTHLERALALHDPVLHKGLESRFGQDIGSAVHTYLAINLMLLGKTQRAEKHARNAEHYARVSDHAHTLSYTHFHLALLALLSHDEAEMERNVAASRAIATEHGMVLWMDYGSMFQETVAAGKGDASSIDRYFLAEAAIIASNVRVFVPLLRIAVGWSALRMGLRERAEELASMAHSMIDETGETIWLADAHRLDGALALDAGNADAAETHLKSAIEVAKAQGARLWELRAAIDLARLWDSAGRTNESAALLAPVYANVADGDCPRERTAAEGLLAEFAS